MNVTVISHEFEVLGMKKIQTSDYINLNYVVFTVDFPSEHVVDGCDVTLMLHRV